MVEKALREIGLTNGEIKVYLSLLELGSSATGAIITKSRVSGSKVYEVLERLKGKGLASDSIINGVRYFEASNPARILDYLDEKESAILAEKKQAQTIIPQLLLRWSSAKKSEVRVFMGFEGLKAANDDILVSLKRGQEYLSMGLSDQPKTWETYFNHWQQARARKGVIHKHLLNRKYKSLHDARHKLPHTQIRFLPTELEMPTSTEIYANKVIINVMTPTNPMAILIESEEVAQSFRKYFYVMWNQAK